MPPGPEPQPYEWSVLRVVPRVERAEFVNVGVVLYCHPLDYLGAELSSDLTRALSLDPELDVAAVAHHLESVRALCAGEPAAGARGQRSPGSRFRWLVSPRSTVVQPAPVHTGLTADPARELADLFRRMVG